MSLDLLIKSVLLIVAIVLFVLAVIIFKKAYHLKGQRFASAILFCFGIAYLFEVVMYFFPVEYSFIFNFWVVGVAVLCGLSLILHYIYYLIGKHALIKTRLAPELFYLYFFIYIFIIGPVEIINKNWDYIMKNGWYVKEDITYSLYIYVIIPIVIIQVLYYLIIGMKYAPSARRKKLYRIYFYGGLGTIIMSFISILLLSSHLIPPEVFLLVSFIPLTLTIGMENYHYSPGFAKHYDKIIEISPVALIVLNRDFQIVEFNKRATQLFKIVKYEPIHQYLETEENMGEMVRFLAELQKNDELTDYTVSLSFNDEVTHLSVFASILELDDEYYYYIMLRDITNEYKQEQRNYYLAYHDTLTSLYNRTYFTQYVSDRLSKLGENEKGAVVLSDLNFFKQINDTYGHRIGDEVLVHTSNLITQNVTSPNVVARLGGDEFIIYFDRVPSESFVKEQICELRKLFQQNPFRKGSVVIDVIPSFGYSVGNAQSHYDQLYHHADIEMYKDKREIKRKEKMRKLV